MQRFILTLTMAFTLAAGAQAASVLDSAEALFKLDAADSGAVSAAQIIDSSGNGHNATATVQPGTINPASLNWTTTPAVGPGGAGAIDLFTDHGRGLELNQTIENAGPPITGNGAGFTVNGLKVSGSATLATRLRWDGHVANTRSWLYSNGNAVNGWLFGVSSTGKLTVYQHQTTYDNLAGALPSLTVGAWYDVVVVIRDNVEDSQTFDTFTFYLYGPDNTLYTQTVGSNTLFVDTTTSGNSLVGSESLGTGSSNQTKAFDGAVDYLAVWDSALTEPQVLSLIVPAPAALPAGLVMLGLTAMRRKRI